MRMVMWSNVAWDDHRILLLFIVLLTKDTHHWEQYRWEVGGYFFRTLAQRRKKHSWFFYCWIMISLQFRKQFTDDIESNPNSKSWTLKNVCKLAWTILLFHQKWYKIDKKGLIVSNYQYQKPMLQILFSIPNTNRQTDRINRHEN